MSDVGHDGILIGEGVVLDARPASFMTRALAIGIDWLAAFLVFLFLDMLVFRGGSGGSGPGLSDQWLTAVIITTMVVIFVGIPATIETLSRGQSLGKLAMGIRVVRDDGGPVRFRHAFIRALVGMFDFWISMGSAALIASLCNPKGKRLGDLVAGTYVIRVRGGRGPQAPLIMHPQLAMWARTADIRRLPDGLALAARQFVNRTSTMAPQARLAMADDLAARIESYVAPAPPYGTPPEVFLHAVLHERRDRELAVGLRAQALATQQAHAVTRLPFNITS
ncbi:MAG: RDD family protein [Promicromonosporaceae bacterium]|nr:RDD family protein [Promicromonosporaceae bacterium]